MRIHGTARGELVAAGRLAAASGAVEHRVFTMPDLMEAGDSGARRLAHLPPTYIPMKNSIFYSVAAAYAEEAGAALIVGGHNADDRGVFEDTSEEFFQSTERSLRAASARLRELDLRIWRPLSAMSKAEVVGLASKLSVPLELTWSCHRAGTTHCWECDGCRKRESAFRLAGVEDPLRGRGDRKGLKRVATGRIRASWQG